MAGLALGSTTPHNDASATREQGSKAYTREALERKMSSGKVKQVEQSVLETFKAEIPSRYFSDKTEKEYEVYKANAAYLYRDLLKFPPQMFNGRALIDFGAGTGENTVYLASWGATCTLVEMNDSAQAISKDVFRKYTANFDEHRFFLSSIFDYQSADRYDIVHC